MREAESNDIEHETPERHEQIVHFEPDDPSNPRNWPSWRKWSIVASITLIDFTVSWGASGYSPAKEDFEQSFHIGSEVGTLGLSLYVFGLSLGPMFLAPLSEYYGRTPLYILPYGTNLLLLMGTALTENLPMFFVLRVFSGMFASVTISNFGGTIADLWPRHQVGPAMSIFLWAAVIGSPSGFLIFSFVAATHGWRDVFWALLIVCGSFWLVVVVTLVPFGNETRHSVILRRRAKRLREERNTAQISVPKEMRQKSLSELFSITLSRPFVFLSTEAIVMCAALYNGFLYGLSFLFNGAFVLVFGPDGYGFDTIGVGLSFTGFVTGVCLGPLVNIWQERHYQRRIRSEEIKSRSTGESTPLLNANNSTHDDAFANLPEARVQNGKIAGLLLPLSLLIFAWTSNDPEHIHYIFPILATVFFGYSFYTLILMSYLYVEDSYMVFSASALAGVGLARNLAGAAFPLFGTQMYEGLGKAWAGMVLAAFALLLAPIPFVLERYGDRLRARSPYAMHHMDDDDDDEGDGG